MNLTRTVFFISDGTGITAETLGHSLLSQFEGIDFRQVRIPFVDSADKARHCLVQIRQAGEADGVRPIVISTLVDSAVAEALREADALLLDFFAAFIAPLEDELGSRSSHAIGRSRGVVSSRDYTARIEAINFTLAHDDGVSTIDLGQSDVILLGVSRSGKTPTSLYLGAAACPPTCTNTGTSFSACRSVRSGCRGSARNGDRAAAIRRSRTAATKSRRRRR